MSDRWRERLRAAGALVQRLEAGQRVYLRWGPGGLRLDDLPGRLICDAHGRPAYRLVGV